MKESRFQPGDLVRHRVNDLSTPPPHLRPGVRGSLLLIELYSRDSKNVDPAGYTWRALGPRGMVSVWESNLTLISRERG